MGWIKKTRDTGWRDVSSYAPGHVSGRMLLRRVGDRAIVVFDDLVLSVSGNNGFTRLESGFWPAYRFRDTWQASLANQPVGTINVSSTGYFNVYNIVADQAMYGRFEWDVYTGWPSTHPGIEVQL